MGRKSKPYWWEAKQGYYSKVNGRRYRLGDTKREAEDNLKALQKQTEKAPTEVGAVAGLLDAFLDWTEANRAKKTYKGYKDFCQSFLNRWPKLRVDNLSPEHVTNWLADQKHWNSTTKRGAITCLQRAVNWGMRNWKLTSNPLHRMEKPEAKRREKILTEKEWKKLLAAIPDAELKELLVVSNEVGCRPQEIRALEARHVDLQNQFWFIPKEEAKGKRKPRVVYMTPVALKIVKRLVKEHPTGKLFLNTRGRPWTASSVKCRFAKLEEKLGVRYCLYNLRHTWFTRKLVAGVDSHVLAQLGGHNDSAMIDRVYSKVAANHSFMLAAARKR